MGPPTDELAARLRHWGEVELRTRLSGGHRNDVFLADLHGRRVVIRHTSRSDASVEWELDLLEHLRAAGVGVPRLVPTRDGRRHDGGLTVQEYVTGDPPSSRSDWEQVADALGAVHAHTTGWRQRPGSASSRDLLTHERGGDVRLDRMPADVVERVRRAWARIQLGEPAVVHGDPGPRNIHMDQGRPVLLDWDEARVDVPWFDLAFLPAGGPLPDGLDPRDVETAGIAWEAATCWTAEPDYAGRQAAVLARRDDHRDR